ncbi:hypothetical protein PanWU01x14_165500 [Parasponia andersonii]|uniref:Uncharacterized protein n=1 Tax=Parasponia andersonii TaxID=3476 RepID=A0A2P5CBT5_PARAD|nr:hypothetical protein PanWU01x14_165500 [Parasponia andersonii]
MYESVHTTQAHMREREFLRRKEDKGRLLINCRHAAVAQKVYWQIRALEDDRVVYDLALFDCRNIL